MTAIDQTLLGATGDYPVRAVLLGERLKLREMAYGELLSTTPPAFRYGGQGVVLLFRFGVVVLINVAADAEQVLIDSLASAVTGPYTQPLSDELRLRLDAQAGDTCLGGAVLVSRISIDRLVLIAEVLARSLVLDQYESTLTSAFDRIEPLALRLRRRWRRVWRRRDLTDHIGLALLTEQRMVGRVEIREKPEVLWDSPELEGFYLRLFDEYELGERSNAIEAKLNLITRTAESLLRLEESRRSLRAEWYIIILILVEILLTLYEMFLRPH